jgi:hypothetical protein
MLISPKIPISFCLAAVATFWVGGVRGDWEDLLKSNAPVEKIRLPAVGKQPVSNCNALKVPLPCT